MYKLVSTVSLLSYRCLLHPSLPPAYWRQSPDSARSVRVRQRLPRTPMEGFLYSCDWQRAASKGKIPREAGRSTRRPKNSVGRCSGRTEAPLFGFMFSLSSTWRPFLLTSPSVTKRSIWLSVYYGRELQRQGSDFICSYLAGSPLSLVPCGCPRCAAVPLPRTSTHIAAAGEEAHADQLADA